MVINLGTMAGCIANTNEESCLYTSPKAAAADLEAPCPCAIVYRKRRSRIYREMRKGKDLLSVGASGGSTFPIKELGLTRGGF